MGFLDDLRKKTLDIASRAYDEVNQFDGGKNWNQRTVTVKGRGAPSGARHLADMTAGNTARLVNTANAGVVQPIVGGLQGKSARQLSREFDRNVYTDRGGLLNVGTFFPTVQDFERNFKDPASFAKGFTGAGVGIATEVAPMVRGASLLMKPGLKGSEKVIRGAAEGAVYGGAGTAAQQQLYNGELDAKGIATGAAFGAGLGGGIPAAGIAGKAGAKTTQHAARIGWESTLKNVAKTADTIDVNPNIVPGATKQLDNQRVLAYANKIANGDTVDPIVVTRDKAGGVKILDGEHRAEAYKALGRPVPTKEINGKQVVDAWERANSSAKQFVPGGTMDAPLNPKDSRFANRTVQNSDEVSPDLKKLVKEEQVTYQATTDKERLDFADKWLKGKSTNKAFNEVVKKLEKRDFDPQGQDGAIGIQLFKKLNSKGDETSLYQATELARLISEKASNKGQEIQILSTLSKRSPDGLRYQAEKELNKVIDGGVTPEISKNLRDFTEAIKKTKPDSKERNQLIGEMQKYVGSLVPDDMVDKVLSAWTAGLISGMKTITGAPASNLTTAALGGITNPLAAGIDATRSAITGGARANTVVSPTTYIKGFAKGLPEAGRYLKTGIDEREQFTQNNFTGGMRETNYNTPGAGTYVNGVFRLMGALDRPFYYGQKAMSEAELAKLERLNQGKKQLPNPGKIAEDEARKSVLDYDTLLSKIAGAMKRAADEQDNVWGRGLGKVATTINSPFVRIPSAGLARMIDFSPAGAPIHMVRQAAEVKWGKQKEINMRDLNKALAESATGTGVVVLGYHMAINNLVSGEYPADDKKEQARWAAEGITPNSVKIFNPLTGKFEWISMNYLGPIGSLLQQGKRFAESKAEGKGNIESAVTAEVGVGRDALNQSYLQGVNSAMEAARDPEQNLMNYVNGLASSGIPAWSNDIANATDDMQRTVNNAGEAIMNRIPLARKTLNEKQDVYGNKLDQRTDPFNLTANPLRPSKQRDSNVLSEVRRLKLTDKADSDMHVTPTKLNKTISVGEEKDGKNVKTKLTNQQRYDLQTAIGQATQNEWANIIKTDKYKALNDKDKAATLRKLREVVSEAETHRYAMANNLGQYSIGFNGKKDKVGKDAQKYMSAGLDITKFAKKKTDETGAPTSSSTSDINPKLDKKLATSLGHFDAFTAEQLEKKYNEDNTAEFRHMAAKYENDKLNGTINEVEDVKRRKALARAEAGSKVSKMTRDLYSMSKADINDFVTNHKDGERLAKELMEYDRLLLNGGLVAYAKFKNGIAPSSRTARGGSRKKSGGRTAKASKGNAADAKVGDRSDAISTTAAVSRRVANAKVSGKIQLTASGRIRRPGIKAYKKADQTKVAVKRNIT